VKMSVIGCGHLGATHAACMASLGHEVIGVDIDEGKVSLLNSGKGWFHEPDLDPMLAESIAAGRLRFTTDFAEAAEFASVHFIGVATPGHADGSYDMSQLRAVLTSLVPHLRGDCLIIGKSTVTPGTAASLQALADRLLRPGQGRVEVAWNPEFLREGCAVADTLRPDRIVVGAVTEAAAETIREVYRPQTDAGIPLVLTDLPTSELAKGAANAFLATKISFINEIANVCEETGADVLEVARGMGLDQRIGKHFLRPGIGFGGSCFPKDVSALKQLAGNSGYHFQLLTAVIEVNELQKRRVVGKLQKHLGTLVGKQIALLGLAFKANTDDMREASSLVLSARLNADGAIVSAYDPVAEQEARTLMSGLDFADTAMDALRDADAVVLVTEWSEFLELDWHDVAQAMSGKLVIDGRNALDPEAVRAAGLLYEGIGRG